MSRLDPTIYVVSDGPDDWSPKWRGPADFLAPVVNLAAYSAGLDQVCESPIEVLFATQLRALLERFPHKVDVIPQFPLDFFRYDFGLECGTVTLLIECDGYEFHSTEKQLANDRRKDAAAGRVGAGILRFSGSDITRNARGCAMVALNQLARMISG